MIHYHGVPMTPDHAAQRGIGGGHAFVPWERHEQLDLVIEICQSFAIDNSAFSAWKRGTPITEWRAFYEWAEMCRRIPSCDFAVVPDVIDGSEADKDALLAEWPLPRWFGAPVWHMHESLERLARLAADWPRICLGSSGQYARVGSPDWWDRMRVAMMVLCDGQGRPAAKLHGLRMLDTKVFTRLPFASADSTNLARNIGIDQRWGGPYPPASKPGRAAVLRDRIEAENAPRVWSFK